MSAQNLSFDEIQPAQRLAARVAGLLYLIQMATAVFGQSYVRDRLIVRGNAVMTAQNILASERLFRLSVVGDLVTYAGVIVLIWTLYVLLRPVSGNLSLLAVFLRLAENAVLCMATVNSLVALRLLNGAPYLDSFSMSQRHSLALLALGAQGLGMSIGFVLLGMGSTVFAYVLWKSRYVPRALAGWGIFSSLLLAGVTLTTIAFSEIGKSLGLTYMMPMGIYEVGLGLWLLVKGVRAPVGTPRFQETAR